MSFLDNTPHDDIIKIISSASSYAEVLQKLGVSSSNSVNRAIIMQYVKNHDIDVQHFNTKTESSQQLTFLSNIVQLLIRHLEDGTKKVNTPNMNARFVDCRLYGMGKN